MSEDQPKAQQSTRPEDTRIARENDLVGEDFDEPEEFELLSVEEIEEAEDQQMLQVPTPEWKTKRGKPGCVYVRNPTGEEKNLFEQEGMIRRGNRREVNLRDLKERLVIWFTCDAERRPLFDRTKLKPTLKWLRTKNAAPINRIADTVLRLGGWTDEDVEDMVGNSEAGPNSSTT